MGRIGRSLSLFLIYLMLVIIAEHIGAIDSNWQYILTYAGVITCGISVIKD